jgi:hypothetical protein
MMNQPSLRVTLDKERRLLRVESDDFMIRFNGLSNQAYKEIFASLGIELVFKDADGADPRFTPKEGTQV